MAGNRSCEKNLIYAVCMLFFIYGVMNIAYGEKIPVGNGFGFDGTIYGNAAKNFYHSIVDKSINSHHLKRIVPSGVIYCCFMAFGFAKTDDAIIMAFGIYNLILIFISVYLWFKIGELLKLSDRLVFMGLVSFLFSYGIMKLNFYYPVLTDTTAFFLGMLAVWGYIKKKNIVLFCCALIGAFTWPTIIYALPLLQIFDNDPLPSTPHPRIRHLLLSGLILVFSGIALYTHCFSPELEKKFGIEIYEWLLPVGLLGFMAYLYLIFNYIADFDIKDFVFNLYKRLNYQWLLIYCGIIVFLVFLSALYPPALGVSFAEYFGWISLGNAAKPLYSFISHMVYYGPVVFVVALFWEKISLNIKQWGAGLTCFFLFNLLQLIDPESRHLIFFFPFVLTVTFFSLKEYKISNLFLTIYVLISLGFSKCWFVINTEEFTVALNRYSPDFTYMFNPGMQRYCMSSGSYMSFTSYIIQGVFVLLSCCMLYIIYIKSKRPCRNYR